MLFLEVVELQYTNLQELIQGSSSARAYFLSLPVAVQLALHEQNRWICSAAQLHIRADQVERWQRAIELSESLNGLFTR